MKLEHEQGLTKNRIETVEKTKNEIKYIGSTRLIKGHTLFSFNRETGEIRKASIKCVPIVTNDGIITKSEVVTEKHCFYDQALNKKNFIKRLNRYGLLRGLNERWVIYCKKFGKDLNETNKSDFSKWLTLKAAEYKKLHNVNSIEDPEDFNKFLS